MPHSTRTGGGTSSRQKPVDVSFSHSKRMAIPREQSSPSRWAHFCSDVTVFAVSGYSIAVALGEDVDSSVSSAQQLAEPMLTQREGEMYSAWKKGKPLPRADWGRLSETLNASTPAQRARWSEMTAALRVLYDSSSLTKENCKAWVEKHDDLMPLLNACKKVETARHDARPAKSAASSKARRDVHEIVSCRKVIAEIGKQRVRSNTYMKKVNKDAVEREADLNKRLSRLTLDAPRDRDSAMSKFSTREQVYSKLTKTKIERLEMAAEVGRQNIEIDQAEAFLKNRISGLEDRLRHGRS